MKQIKQLIKQRGQQYSQHPFIQFVRNDKLDAKQRLSFLPHTVYFLMSFFDVNYLLLPNSKLAHDPIQALVNAHSEEDNDHWPWALHDLQVLGFNPTLPLVDAVRSIWADKHIAARKFSYRMAHYCIDSPPILKLVFIEAIETMGEIWLQSAVNTARQLACFEQLIYIGEKHLKCELEHTKEGEDLVIDRLEIPQDLRARAEEIVNGLFDGMEAFNQEILDLTLADHQLEDIAKTA